MKLAKLILGMALLAAAIYLGTNLISNRSEPAAYQSPAPQIPQTKTDEQGQVIVKITPVDLGAETPSWKFQIVLDTHSVELDYDFLEAVSLFDEQGKKYKAISWEGSPPGGHHREGILTFRSIKPAPRELKMEMFNVGDIEVRNFTWKLN